MSIKPVNSLPFSFNPERPFVDLHILIHTLVPIKLILDRETYMMYTNH